MKDISTLALVLGLGALAPFAAAAAQTPEQTYVDSARRAPNIPAPLSVVAPNVEGFDIGKSARIEFVVDATGQATDFNVLSTDDPALASAVIDAVMQWRFEPAHQNGVPVAARVILPVSVGAHKPATM